MFKTYFRSYLKGYWQTLSSYGKCFILTSHEKITTGFFKTKKKNHTFFHFQCFTCVICQTTLDGVPFTVDATNEIHCIDDFHKRFAPKCSVCKTPIMTPDPGQQEVFRVVALDRSFHVQCYKCEDCGLLLSSEAEGKGCYPLDDHVLCKACNTKRIQLLTQDIQ